MKNRALRIASILLGVVLTTACVFSGTLAKYLVADSGYDIARIAKWGVKISLSGDLFNKEYINADGAVTVKSSATENKIAPGTEKTLLAAVIKGKPEVNAVINGSGRLSLSGDWTDEAGSFYCPLEFTVEYTDGSSKSINGSDYTSREALEAAIGTLFEIKDAQYAAGRDLSTADFFKSIGWKWDYTDDTRDTFLGVIAAGNGGTNPADGAPYETPGLSLSYELTVTQAD